MERNFAQPNPGARVSLGHDALTLGHALIADEHFRSRDKLSDLVLRLTAEAAIARHPFNTTVTAWV